MCMEINYKIYYNNGITCLIMLLYRDLIKRRKQNNITENKELRKSVIITTQFI